MSRLGSYALLAALAVSSTTALAEEPMVKAGDFLVRVRGLVVAPDDSARISGIGGTAAIETSVVPEVDFSYFLTDTIAVELIAAVTRHDVRAVGTALGDVALGDLLLLPPTLTLQYHLPVTEDFKPYLGAGVNYTFFIDEDAEGGIVTRLRAKDSFGWALQAGADYRISGPFMLNVDVKKLFLDTRASINGGAITADVDIDPWIFGIGIGYRF